ncbi:hypothetical protein MKW98_009584 [Papaver atlanticum]|uniref:S-acyltransferase n=1 Tax=Papaver atlanticum TaxID=357466 RepID=A0AAD4SDK4_9MAGN|nr:hypothetical protein MKW98_009584 [Papaver atlanticum]
MKKQRFLSLPIFAVFLAMGFIYYTTVFIFIEDSMSLNSSNGLLNALIFSFLALMSFISFITCIVMEPGHVPANFVLEIENGGEVLDQGSNKNGGNPRFCDKCATHKPPRTHHCRVCRRCVLKMDHHCVWINNCVGFVNYKPFFILILYATTASLYSTVMLILDIFQKDWDSIRGQHLKLFYIICGTVLIALSVTLTTLSGWHVYLLAQNMTTIEYHEGIRASWLAKKSGQNYRHPYNLGVYKNITSTLGSNVFRWLWPTAVGHLKDGTNFSTTSRSS